MLLASLVLVSMTPSRTWPQVLARLTAHPAGYPSTTDPADFSRWINNLGMGADYVNGKDVGGIELNGPSIARVQGVPRSLLVSLGSSSSPGRTYPKTGALVLFQREIGKVRASVVEEGVPFEGGLAPAKALLTKNRLYVAGSWDWFSNFHHGGIESYARTTSGWKKISSFATKWECWDTPNLRLGSQGLPARLEIESYAYPPHLGACHATSNYRYQERWIFTGGMPKMAWRKRCNTPYNTLDALYGHLGNGDRQWVRDHCRSESIFRKIWAFRNKLSRGQNDVYWPNDRPNDIEIGLYNLAIFRFAMINGRWVVSKLS